MDSSVNQSVDHESVYWLVNQSINEPISNHCAGTKVEGVTNWCHFVWLDSSDDSGRSANDGESVKGSPGAIHGNKLRLLQGTLPELSSSNLDASVAVLWCWTRHPPLMVSCEQSHILEIPDVWRKGVKLCEAPETGRLTAVEEHSENMWTEQLQLMP